MNTTYEALYDIVEQRLQDVDRPMPCSRQAFLFAAGMKPGECDGRQLAVMENEEFFQSVYLGLFNRLPDSGAKLVWEEKMKLNSTQFRETVLDALLCSPEAVTKSSCLMNNQLVPVKQRPLTVLDNYMLRKNGEPAAPVKAGWKDYLYKLYIRFPLPLRKLARKILRRD
ncbi:MAG: DUF4214 domain-containing protein [Bacteroides sp.]|nr:DUF4214 domain-containing protein [Bacteroides sp.]MCM1548461.1 DUF4214 domain-containing protein [Clostridium sp.]